MTEDLLTRGLKALLFTILTCATLFVAFAVLKSASASGQVEFCYIEFTSATEGPPLYKLYGFRSWRNDYKVGVFLSLNEAADAATKMNCKIGSR